jgi:hypothetical protein
MTARFAFNPCKTKVKISALQIPVNDLYDIFPPESESGCIVVIPNLLKFLEMGFDAFIVTTDLWIPRLINLDSVEIGHGL